MRGRSSSPKPSQGLVRRSSRTPSPTAKPNQLAVPLKRRPSRTSSLGAGTRTLQKKPPVSPSSKGVAAKVPPAISKPMRTRSNLSRTSTISVGGKESSPGRTAFHVRVALGYLTGLKVEQISKKKKRNSHNSLVVGYAALAKSGKQLALSQPLITNIDQKRKSSKLFWANPKGKKAVGGQSSVKRRIHFSLQLEREKYQASPDDDGSIGSTSPYLPEVVKLEIGLKCGDEKFPLGFANLVVNGRDVALQKIDLSVRPVDDVVSSKDGNRPQKSILSIFGTSKKPAGILFSNGNNLYKLAPNATLRVRVDIKPGNHGDNKSMVWGGGDDASYTTNFTYETRGTMASLTNSLPPYASSQRMGGIPQNQFHEKETPVPGALLTEVNNSRILKEKPKRAQRISRSTSQKQEKPIRSKMPMKYVVVRPPYDGRSLASGLTAPTTGYSFFYDCFAIDLCGDTMTVNDSRQMRSDNSSIESNLNEEVSISSVESSISNPPGMVLESSENETSEGEDSPTDARQETQKQQKISRSLAENERQPTNLDGSHLDAEGIVEGDRGAERVTSPVAADDGGSVGAETVDITVDTYTDLKSAQATLLRYASKVGIEMEELLEGMDKAEKGLLKRSSRSDVSALHATRRK